MVAQGRSPNDQLKLLQAWTARALVEEMGVPARRAAHLLGIAPSAVSQYLSGKRLARLGAPQPSDRSRRAARRLASRLAKGNPDHRTASRLLLRAAAELASPGPGAAPEGDDLFRMADGSPIDRPTARRLRARVVAEQSAVADCMRLAQKARDELTRAIFRQLASDSLRHAEIVASLSTYLDRGISETSASGISRRDVERLIEREQRAETQAGVDLVSHLGGVMALLVASMEADERKHEELLRGLLRTELPG
jgi:uncharacterized protein